MPEHCNDFSLCEDGYYRVPEWLEYAWLRHGFGTRNAPHPHGSFATVKQIHSADVSLVDQPGPQGTGDALVCRQSNIFVAIRTADCFPILLVDPVQGVVSAVHAGWRGSARKIVQRALHAMTENYGTRARDVEAAIGPGIGKCCFQVGPEVAREFGPYPGDDKTYLDLRAINTGQLSGVRAVHQVNLCTFCNKGKFDSFRREKEAAGRMISYVGKSAGAE